MHGGGDRKMGERFNGCRQVEYFRGAVSPTDEFFSSVKSCGNYDASIRFLTVKPRHAWHEIRFSYAQDRNLGGSVHFVSHGAVNQRGKSYSVTVSSLLRKSVLIHRIRISLLTLLQLHFGLSCALAQFAHGLLTALTAF
jgi:hypothetical protein